MKVEYKITDVQVLAAFARAPAVMNRNLQQGLDSAAMKMIQAARQELHNNDSLSLSTLIQSIAYKRSGLYEREVEPGTDYAIYLEKGTSAGYYPATNPLQAWLKARGAAEPQRSVFKLRQHIFKHGTQAHPFWQPAFEKAEPTMRQAINDAVRRGIREVFA